MRQTYPHMLMSHQRDKSKKFRKLLRCLSSKKIGGKQKLLLDVKCNKEKNRKIKLAALQVE